MEVNRRTLEMEEVGEDEENHGRRKMIGEGRGWEGKVGDRKEGIGG